MKKKFRALLAEKCKDMGLTDKALDDLTENGIKALKDDASDEDISNAVDSLVPLAKIMQGEITRKTSQRRQQSADKPSENGEGNGEGTNQNADKPEWAKQLEEKVNALQSENEALKAEKTKAERTALIAEKAKKLGIPEYLIKRFSIAEDADIDKELADYKQDLVNNNLMPKEAAHETGTTDEAMKANAKTWAESLPNL